jgi:alkanesulfonate monooxygenase SsuD/methylene tetrahydromethanopterin reductase-like flavin-dependent oxidoreductase (luciferase family)
LVAQYADESNLICGPDEIPRKLEVLADHCANLGRDRAEITVSYLTSACIAPTHEQAIADFEEYLTRQPQANARRSGVIVGSPDEVAEKYSVLRDAGIDGIAVNAPANGHVEGRVALLGETLAPLFIR